MLIPSDSISEINTDGMHPIPTSDVPRMWSACHLQLYSAVGTY